MKIIRSNIFIAGCFLSMLLGSCSKNIAIDSPIDALITDAVFADSSASVSAALGVYSAQTKVSNSVMGFLNGAVTVLPALSADELVTSQGVDLYDQFATNQIQPLNTAISQCWNDAYAIIFQCNLVIENLDKSTKLTQTLKNQLGGEMRFMRALNYFYLTNEFGRVPLTTSSDYRINSQLAKSDTALVYTQIIKDLKEAQNLLVDNYPGTEKIRANRLAAEALLAKVYLYQRNYADAATQASLVINSNRYQLSKLSNTFLANNTEAIMQLSPPIASLFATAEGLFLLPMAGYTPTFKMTPQLLADFETGDLRMTNWVTRTTINGNTFYYQYKYKVMYATANVVKTEYNVMLRLGEQYLIRAEALAQQGSLPAAIKDIDSIRNRAGLPLIATANPGISQADLVKAISHENRIEFFLEWGHRWFDLKRTGQAGAVLAPIKGAGWQPTDVLYPIPAAELLVAPNLRQNDGYTN